MSTFPSPKISLPDDADLKQVIKVLRDVARQQAASEATIQRQLANAAGVNSRTNLRLSENKMAVALYTQEGPVWLEIANRPNDGDVLYAVNATQAAWGAGGVPAPTDPGTGPAVGKPHPLLDGDQNNDTVAQAPSRGSLIYGNATPLWDELVKPSVRSVLLNDATDMVYVATPTRVRWLPDTSWMLDGTTAATTAVRGTAPNSYHTWEFPVTGPSTIVSNWQIPDDWRTGVITFAVWWLTAGATATNWVPTLTYKERVDGDDYSAAGTGISPGAVSANFGNHILKKTTLGSFTPSLLAEQVRLDLSRTPGGLDTCLGSIYIVGVEASYTPLY